MIKFLYPMMLLLFVLPVVLRMIMPVAKGMHGDALRVPFLKDIKSISQNSGRVWKSGVALSGALGKPLLWLYLIWALLCVAAARPQLVGEPIRVKNYGRDILMIMDISTSMLERDFVINNYQVSRLTAVKQVAKQFIEARTNDRIGLVLFGTRAYLQAPITFDKKSVEEILMNMDAGMAGNTTAIGDALGVALKYLKDTPNKDKKIIILLTDGYNNDGMLRLPEALYLAKKEGVKIYTIGVSSDDFEVSFLGMKLGAGTDLDEKSLQILANETKGRYFRAKDTGELARIYAEIDKLEPNENDDNFVQEAVDLFYVPLLVALILGMLMVAWRKK